MVALIATPSLGLAQEPYQLIEGLPGILEGDDDGNPETSGDAGTLKNYIEGVYNIGIWVVGIAALVMIVVGGFTYIASAGNQAKTNNAKDIIKDALLGLLVVLFTVIILQTINPELAKFEISSVLNTTTGSDVALEPVQDAVPGPPSTETRSAAQAILDNDNITLEQAPDCALNGVGVTPAMNLREVSSGDQISVCSNGCNSSGGCTKQNISLDENMLTSINAVAQNNELTITSIAGGNHSATSGHYKGKGVDIIPKSTNPDDWNRIVQELKSKGLKAECDIGGSYSSCSNMFNADGSRKQGAHIDIKS